MVKQICLRIQWVDACYGHLKLSYYKFHLINKQQFVCVIFPLHIYMHSFVILSVQHRQGNCKTLMIMRVQTHFGCRTLVTQIIVVLLLCIYIYVLSLKQYKMNLICRKLSVAILYYDTNRYVLRSALVGSTLGIDLPFITTSLSLINGRLKQNGHHFKEKW